MLDLKLNTFAAVLEHGSYTAAAQALHLTQPAVTQHIQKLEEHYQCRFFIQEGRSMHLTEQGRQFAHYVKMQHTNEQQLIAALHSPVQPMRLGCTLSIADYYLPSILPPVSLQEDPLNIQVANTTTLLEELIRGALDAAFIEGNFSREVFASHKVCNAPFVAVASASHPLTKKPTLSLQDLHPYPLILREQGSGTRDITEGYLKLQNDSVASFPQVWEANSFLLLKRLLTDSQAISFMYEAVVAKEVADGELSLLPLEGYTITHPLHFVWLNNGLDTERINTFFARCRLPES